MSRQGVVDTQGNANPGITRGDFLENFAVLGVKPGESRVGSRAVFLVAQIGTFGDAEIDQVRQGRQARCRVHIFRPDTDLVRQAQDFSLRAPLVAWCFKEYATVRTGRRELAERNSEP